MLINAIRAENLKSRHSNMWVAVLILPLLTAAIGAIIYGINASANLYDGAVWQQLWLQTGLFYGYFFFPILIAICASYLWRLEHTNHNWNSLMTTPVSRPTIFIAKLVVLTKSILTAQVLLMVFIIIVGKVVFRFEQPIPINMLWWLFMGWFSALSVGAVQLYLSMRIRSFAVPVGLAVCLSIGGLAFHIAGSLAFKEAMQKAAPVLLEPIMKVEVTTPEDYMGDVIGDINSRRGRIEGMEDIGGGKMIKGYVPLAEMFGYATDLRSRTQGRGNYSMFFEKYEPVPKNVQEKVLAAKAK